MLLTILILIFILILSRLLKFSIYGRIILGLITYLIIILVCGKVTYTPDWEGYEYLIKNENRLEIFFNFISEYALKNGFTYKDVHFFYISIYTFFLLWLISIFNNNLFVVSVLYMIFVFLFYATQIRFFMGYYAGILALYYFFQDRRLFLSVALFLFAVLNHSSLIILLLYIPLYSIKVNRLIKIVTMFAITTFIFFYILVESTTIVTLINNYTSYSNYISIENRSSTLGGLALLLPFILYFPFLMRYYFKVRNMMSIKGDIKKIDFLCKMTIIPIVFIGISVYIQIIGHRFVIPSLLLSLLLFFQLIRYDKYNRTSRFIFIIFIVSGILYYYFLLPSITNSEINEIIIRMLDSNPIIQNLKI